MNFYKISDIEIKKREDAHLEVLAEALGTTVECLKWMGKLDEEDRAILKEKKEKEAA